MPYGYTNPAQSPTGRTQTSTGETFIQRQQRLQQGTQQKQASSLPPGVAAPTSNSSYAAPASTGTPVSGNGGIPEPAPIPVAAPAPNPAPPPPMSLSDKEAAAGIKDMGNNLVYVPAYGGVVDRNNNWYIQAMKDYEAKNPGGTSPGTPTVPTGTEHDRGEASKSGMFTQFQSPDHDFENWQQLQLIQQILANPDTLSPHVIDQLQQKMTEEQLLMDKQLSDQQREDLAGRGMALSGGTANAQNRSRQEEMMKAILGKRRDIEVAAAQQNRQDELNALGAAESILQGQTGRAGSIYDNILRGETANRGDYWTGKQLDLQDKLGSGGLAIDQNRLNEQAREFNTSFPLSILQFLEGQRQFNDNSGFNWTSLGQNSQNALWDRIMQAAGF